MFQKELISNRAKKRTVGTQLNTTGANALLALGPSARNNQYFTIHETPVRGKVYSFNEDAIRKAERNYGYFALMTNGIKDPVEALRIYRLKDLIEKSFGNLKERLSMRRMSVASEENFEGKLFVQFIALQLMSYIKKQMDPALP